jgi:hypothetical protein
LPVGYDISPLKRVKFKIFVIWLYFKKSRSRCNHKNTYDMHIQLHTDTEM